MVKHVVAGVDVSKRKRFTCYDMYVIYFLVGDIRKLSKCIIKGSNSCFSQKYFISVQRHSSKVLSA